MLSGVFDSGYFILTLANYDLFSTAIYNLVFMNTNLFIS